jgi:Flp pilus assembly protein TadD
MKKALFIIILVVLVGLGLALVVKPSSQEVALMNLKDKKFSEALTKYEAQYNNGNRNPEVINALVELYLQEARVEDAILVLEDFIKSNPDNIDAYKKIGTLYQYAQRPDDYRKNLEELYKLEKSPEVLSELAKIYSFNADYEKQTEIIQQLLDSENNKDPQNFLDLANLLAAQKKYPQAIKTLQSLDAAFPDRINFEIAELKTSLLMDNRDFVTAYEEAQKYLDKQDKQAELPSQEALEGKKSAKASLKPGEIARLTNLLHYKGSPELALKLIEPYADRFPDSDDIEKEYIPLLIANDRGDDAYDRLVNLRAEKGALPISLYELFISLAMEREEYELVSELVKEVNIADMQEKQIIYLVELTGNKVLSDLRGHVLSSVTTEMKQQMPLLDAVIDLETEGKKDDKAFALIESAEVPTQDKLILARFCARNGAESCAEKALEKLEGLESLTDQQIYDVGEIYLQLGKTKAGLSRITAIRESNRSSIIDDIWLKLSVAENSFSEVSEWLGANKETVSSSTLRDLFYIAFNRNHDDLAVYLAESLVELKDTDNNKKVLATAYLRAGKYAEAVELTRDARLKSKASGDIYLESLYKAAKNNNKYAEELTTHISELLKDKSLPEKRKQELVFALIDHGRADIAETVVASYARAGGDGSNVWASIYEGILRKAGRSEDLRDFWMERLTTGISEDTRRNIGFGLLESGFRTDAAGVFRDLAATGGPANKDLSQYLYISGPRPASDVVEWLVGRFNNSGDNFEKVAWLKHVSNTGDDARVIELVNANPDLLDDESVADVYLSSLVRQRGALGDAKVRANIEKLIEITNTPKVLNKYASFAEQLSYPDLARRSYLKSLEIDPKNLQANLGLGVFAFGRADYSEVKKYLGQYTTLRSAGTPPENQAYLGYFYFAEANNRNGSKKIRQQYANHYQEAIALIDAEGVKTPEMLSVKAQSLIRLGKTKEGFEQFKTAREQYPDNGVLKADVISAHIENLNYEAARQELSGATVGAVPQIGGQEGGSSAGRVLSLPKSAVSSWSFLSENREILVNLNGLAENMQVVNAITSLSKEKQSEKPVWFSYATTGYDQLLISADSNYKIAVDDNSGDLLISGEYAPATSGYNLKEQLDLRMKLLAARIDLETGKHYKASRDLQSYIPEFPADPQLLGFAANAEYYTGFNRAARQHINEAYSLMPENEDIERLWYDIRREHAANVKLNHNFRMLGDNNEHITSLSGFGYFGHPQDGTKSKGLKAGAVYDFNQVDSDLVRRADGREGEFEEDKHRAEVFAEYETMGGQTVKGSLFANEDTLGLGGYYNFLSKYGKTGFGAELRRPYWDFVEGALDEATRDRLELNHNFKLNNKTNFYGGLSGNRYNVEDASNVASSVGYQFGVYRELKREYPYTFGLAYSIDGEYRMDNKTARDAAGESYKLFPLVSREVHFPNAQARYDFTEATFMDGYLGYAFDRYGGHGPSGGLRLNHSIAKDFELELRASHGIFSGESDEDLSVLGGHFKWKF